jgi:thioredoxin
MMSELKEVTQETFEADVIAHGRPVLIDFWAPWCGPCKALAPTLRKLSGQYADEVDFVKVNVDEHAAVRDRFGVRGIPTLILLQGEAELGRVVGNRSASQLAGFIDGCLGTTTALPAALSFAPNAFGGEAAFKQARLNALHEHIERKRAAPGEPMWDGEESGALQFVAQSTDIDEAASKLGISADVLGVAESLSSYHGTHLGAAAFIAQWLASVRPGANLSVLHRRLLVAILHSAEFDALLGDDTALSAVRDALVVLHDPAQTDARTDAFTAQLAQVDAALSRVEAKESDPRYAARVTLLKTLAQRLNDVALTTDLIAAVTREKWRELRETVGWTAEDDRCHVALMETLWKQAQERGETPLGNGELAARAARHDPELIRRFHAHYDEGTRYSGAVGSAIGEWLIRLTREAA